MILLKKEKGTLSQKDEADVDDKILELFRNTTTITKEDFDNPQIHLQIHERKEVVKAGLNRLLATASLKLEGGTTYMLLPNGEVILANIKSKGYVSQHKKDVNAKILRNLFWAIPVTISLSSLALSLCQADKNKDTQTQQQLTKEKIEQLSLSHDSLLLELQKQNQLNSLKRQSINVDTSKDGTPTLDRPRENGR